MARASDDPYTIAAIGWQYAVPVGVLAKITENGDGGPIGAIARTYLPPAWSWIARQDAKPTIAPNPTRSRHWPTG